LVFRRYQLGEMRYGENLPYECCLGSRRRFKDSRILFRPRYHIGL
jgi:hypothetical protein